jgi:hypothetical protein
MTVHEMIESLCILGPQSDIDYDLTPASFLSFFPGTVGVDVLRADISTSGGELWLVIVLNSPM